MIITLSGLSGVGKTRIMNELARAGYERVITYTTRKPRDGEQHGVDYNFVSKDVFNVYKGNEQIWESTEYFGEYYGSPNLDADSNHVIVVDEAGAMRYKQHYGDKCLTVLLTAELHVRKRRLLNRGDDIENIVARISEGELSGDKFDLTIDATWDTPVEICEQIKQCVARVVAEV